MNVDHQAAWVPFDQDNGQTPAALALAVAWEGRGGLLITPKKDIALYAEPIQQFAARHQWTTRRGGMRRRPTGGGPVLVHCPMFDDLKYATDLGAAAATARVVPFDVPEGPDDP